MLIQTVVSYRASEYYRSHSTKYRTPEGRGVGALPYAVVLLEADGASLELRFQTRNTSHELHRLLRMSLQGGMVGYGSPGVTVVHMVTVIRRATVIQMVTVG